MPTCLQQIVVWCGNLGKEVSGTEKLESIVPLPSMMLISQSRRLVSIEDVESPLATRLMKAMCRMTASVQVQNLTYGVNVDFTCVVAKAL